MEININTPALLFPAITLLLLAYTNRFLALAGLVRKLHDEYKKGEKNFLIIRQIRSLRSRINVRAFCCADILCFVSRQLKPTR